MVASAEILVGPDEGTIYIYKEYGQEHTLLHCPEPHMLNSKQAVICLPDCLKQLEWKRIPDSRVRPTTV